MAPARDAEKDQRRDREEPEDEFDRIEQHLPLARAEPAFEHRDDPDHDAEVRGVIGVMLATQVLDIARSQDPSSLKCLEAAMNEFRETRVIAQPEPERHAESVF